MAKRRTVVPRLPLASHPDSAAREYYRNLRKYADAYIRLMAEGLKKVVPALQEIAAYETPDPQPASRSDGFRSGDIIYVGTSSSVKVIRMDANIEERIKELFASVELELERTFPAEILQQWVRSMIGHTNQHVKKNMQKLVGKVGLEIEPLMHDRGLSPFFQNAVDENVGLIRSISQYRLSSFKNGLVYGITNDMPQDQIRKMIQGNYRVTRAKARFLAVDQVNKLNADLNQYRQQQLGGSRYRWRGSKDSRERPDHVKLNDTIQSWAKPPITDRKTKARNHPGKDYRCRCRAEMVIEDILD